MRFGLQILSFKPGELGGQGIFIRRLLSHLVPKLGPDRLVIFLRPQLASEPQFGELDRHASVRLVVQTPDQHHGDGYADWNLRLLESAELDVVYFPLSFFFPRPLPIPVLLHVPDLQHEYFPQYFPADQLAWRRERIPDSVRCADAVISYTRFSVSGLRDKLGADERKLHTIAIGGFLDSDIQAALDAGAEPPGGLGDRPFIFYPAADWPHKNHETLLRAIAILARSGRREQLVLTGIISQRGDELRRLADELGISDRLHWLGRVSQDELIALYRAARLMAFPSRFEGFGIPLVEAMQLGCPVVASKAEAVMETAGGAAEFCDDDPERWAESLARVLSDESIREDLRRRGKRRARDFDWERCADKHLALLRELARR